MIRKQIQKHNFLTGGPILQYEIPFNTNILNVDTITTVLVDNNYTTTNFRPHMVLHNHQGDNIFRVDEDRITYYDQEIVTEDRVRDIVREAVMEVMNERNINVE
jgi:hypothetical protein